MFQSTNQTKNTKKESKEPPKENSSSGINLDEMMSGHESAMNAGDQPVQRMVKDEEELIQGKANGSGPVQLMVREEEETKQKKVAQKQPDEEEELVQGKSLDGGVSESAAQSQSGNSSHSSLPSNVQSKMENSFGTSFADVNIHKNDESATNMGALAYTQGNNVHFAPGQFSPDTQSGQELIGHELTHVVQQREGRVKPTKQGKGMAVNDSPALENEADVLGKKAAEGNNASVEGTGSGIQMQLPEGVSTVPDTPAEIIRNAYNDYKAGKEGFGMPQLARAVLPYAQSNPAYILWLFDELSWTETDTFSYALANNATNDQLLRFSDELLQKISTSIDTFFTLKGEENKEQKGRVDEALNQRATPEGRLEILLTKASLTLAEVKSAKELIGQVSESQRASYMKRLLPLEAAADLQFAQTTFDNTISGNVGHNQANNAEDVKKVANGLVANGFTVNDASINNGTCDATMVQAIKDFEREKLVRPNNRIVGYLTPGSWTGDYDTIFGEHPRGLNDALRTWKRGEEYDSATGLTNYTINDNGFIAADTYEGHIDGIAEDKEIGTESDDGKAIATAARAATDEAYFNEITKNVTSELNLSSESVESHQVNPILKSRLTRFHKYLSAVGLFSGNMTGGACRSAKVAHRIAIPHVIVDNLRPASSKTSIRENVKKVFNGETVAGGSKDGSNNVKDTDGNIWAKSEHFNKDEDGKATSLKDTEWKTHLKEVSGRTTWGVYIAEGYKRDDTKRFPLGLDKSPGRSNHITGDAIDINASGFLNMNDTKIDIIALYFGVSRPVPGEQWHFECVNSEVPDHERDLINQSTRNTLV